MNADEILRRTLARKSPPPGFRERVMAQTVASTPRSAPWRGWRTVAAGLLLTATISGWTAWKVEQRRTEGERAKHELMLALHIAGEKVRAVQQDVKSINE